MFFGRIVGALLGLMLFLRYDVVLAMAAFAAAATVMPAQRGVSAWPSSWRSSSRSCGLWYLVNPMIALFGLSVGLHARSRRLGAGRAGTRRMRGWFDWLMRTDRRANAIVRRGLPAGLALRLALLAIYAVLLPVGKCRTALHDAMAFRTFAWYITPWALGGAVAGMVAARCPSLLA